MTARPLTNVEAAFRKLWTDLQVARQIAATTKAEAHAYGWSDLSSPFERYAHDSEDSFKEMRKTLVTQLWRQYNDTLTPNIEREDADFLKLMDMQAGVEGFNESVIQAFFTVELQNRALVAGESIKQLQAKVAGILPWEEAEDSDKWDDRKPTAQLAGKTLLLHCYTWDASYNQIETYRHGDEIAAFEKLVLIANGAEPITTTAKLVDESPLTLLMHNTDRYDKEMVEGFYSKHETPDHPTIASFHFYKNGKLLVEFKTEEAARKVALTICPLLRECEYPGCTEVFRPPKMGVAPYLCKQHREDHPQQVLGGS